MSNKGDSQTTTDLDDEEISQGDTSSQETETSFLKNRSYMEEFTIDEDDDDDDDDDSTSDEDRNFGQGDVVMPNSAVPTWMMQKHTNSGSAVPQLHHPSFIPIQYAAQRNSFQNTNYPCGFPYTQTIMQAEPVSYVPSQYMPYHLKQEGISEYSMCNSLQSRVMLNEDVYPSPTYESFPDVATLKQETSVDIVNFCEGQTLEQRYKHHYNKDYFSKFVLNKTHTSPTCITTVGPMPSDIAEGLLSYLDYIFTENYKKLNEIVYPLSELSSELQEAERKKLVKAIDEVMDKNTGYFPTPKFLGWMKLFGLEVNVTSVGTYFLHKTGPPVTLVPLTSAKKKGKKNTGGTGPKKTRKRGRPPKRKPIVASDEDEETLLEIKNAQEKESKRRKSEEHMEASNKEKDVMGKTPPCVPNTTMFVPKAVLPCDSMVSQLNAHAPWPYENVSMGSFQCMPTQSFREQLFAEDGMTCLQIGNPGIMPDEAFAYYNSGMVHATETHQNYEENSENSDFENGAAMDSSVILDLDSQ